MLKKSLISLGNLLIEKKNMHLPCNKLEYGQFPGMYLFVIDNLNVLITDYVYIF